MSSVSGVSNLSHFEAGLRDLYSLEAFQVSPTHSEVWEPVA